MATMSSYSLVSNRFWIFFKKIYQIRRDFLCNAQKVLCNNRHAYTIRHFYSIPQSCSKIIENHWLKTSLTDLHIKLAKFAKNYGFVVLFFFLMEPTHQSSLCPYIKLFFCYFFSGARMHFKRIIALWSSHKDFLNTNSARLPAGRKVISVVDFLDKSQNNLLANYFDAILNCVRNKDLMNSFSLEKLN